MATTKAKPATRGLTLSETIQAKESSQRKTTPALLISFVRVNVANILNENLPTEKKICSNDRKDFIIYLYTYIINRYYP